MNHEERLSKLQLYLWTVATIFGYVYLAVARSMIQGHYELPPVPQNLVNLLLVSLATAVGAEAITGVHGPKGAGKVLPSLADFITSGGVVAADRLQFFVWTWVGVIGFLFLILISDPGTIEELPPIPDGLLYLMALSSAGYLGGKLSRTSGPVIDSVTAQRSAPVSPALPAPASGATPVAPGGPATLVLVIEGRNLSPKADFYIDGVVVRAPPPDSQAVAAQMDATLRVVHGDSSATDKSFATALQLTNDRPVRVANATRHAAVRPMAGGPAQAEDRQPRRPGGRMALYDWLNKSALAV